MPVVDSLPVSQASGDFQRRFRRAPGVSSGLCAEGCEPSTPSLSHS